MTTNTKRTNNKPVQSFRSGLIQAAVWRNEAPTNGNIYYSVTFSRSFQVDDEGTKQWRQSQSFGPQDLPHLKRVLRSAEDWIASQPT